MNKLKWILLSFIAFLAFPGLVKAVDLTVTCLDNGSCNISPVESPLFYETNWLPGDSVTRRITAVNEDRDEGCNLFLSTESETQTPADFPSKLFTDIKDGTVTVYGGGTTTLNNLYGAASISLGYIPPLGGSKLYDWRVTFDPATGNYYQGAETKFDFDLTFSCGTAPTPAPTSGGTTLGLSAASAPSCGDTKPNLPSNFRAVAGGAGEVVLSWAPPSTGPYTYFLVAYSDDANWPPKWGNPNMGNVSSYVVSGLGAGNYWFWLRAGNGCMPGDFIGPITPGVIGGIAGAGEFAEGFIPGALGIATEVTPTPTALPEVEGASTCTDKYFPWWIILVLQALVSFVYLWSRWKDKTWWVVIGIAAIVSQIAHEIFGCNCATGVWCPRFWILNLIIILLSLFARMLLTRRKSE